MAKPKLITHVRKVFLADVRSRSERTLELRIRPGCWRRVLDAKGARVEEDIRMDTGAMWASVGDGLLIAATDVARVAEVAVGRVVATAGDGRGMTLEVLAGVAPNGTSVHVMRCVPGDAR